MDSNQGSSLEILAVDGLSYDDKAKIAAQLSDIKTPSEAQQKAVPLGFALQFVDHRGRIATLTYHGIEVMLFFKRMTARLNLLPSETTRAVSMTEDQAWLACNLLDEAGYGLISQLKLRVKSLEEELWSMKSQNDNFKKVIDQQETYIASVTTKATHKAAKSAPPLQPVALMETETIRKMLARIRPYPLQDFVRSKFLNMQDPAQALVQNGIEAMISATYKWQHGKGPKPAKRQITVTKKYDSIMIRIQKAMPLLKQKSEAIPYQAPPPRVRKSKTAKPTVNKTKPVVKKGAKKKK